MKFSKAITSFLVLATTVESVVIDTIPQFTKTINNEIVCEKVVEQHQLVQKTDDIKDGVIGKSRFVCVVAPEYTPSGEAYGIKLSMNDTDESFRSAFTAAKKTGHTELWIKNPLVEGSSVKLPSTSNERSSSATPFSGSLFHKEVIEVVERIGGRALRSSSETMKSKTCYSPLLQWRKPKDTQAQKRRNLAVNQTGTRSVIVFRVKVGTSQLTNSALEISEELFSTASNMITLVSQTKACSFDQLIFAPSTSSSFDFAEDSDGVVEVTFTSGILQNTDQATDIENAIKTQYGSAMNDVDHKVYAVPPDTQNDDGETDWVAYADFPGDDGTYRDYHVINVSTQMHEFGHNLGLAHSGGKDYYGEDGEYEDETCYMGYGENDDHAICWNAAKSAELGWYDDRGTTIYPHAGDEFNGRLIGVNDYGISTSSDTLVVEIKNSDSSVNSYFLMYNKAEGINGDAEEAINQIVIVQGATSEQSWRVAEITPGSSWTKANYFLDKTLVISTQTEASSGNVQYVSTTIKFQDKSCSSDNDCSSLPTCFSEQCSSNVCEIVREADCCGNELCDDSEFCNTCDDCLQNSDHCTNLDASDWSGANTSSGAYGTSFDVTASTNIYIHEIDAFVWEGNTSHTVKVYTRSGTNSGESNLNNWEKVFDGSITSDDEDFVTIPLSSRVDVSSGSTQAFYIDMTGSSPTYKVGYDDSNVNTQSNNDVTISILTVREERSGTTIGDVRGTSGFVGMVKYGYAKSSTPTSPTPVSPTQAPTPAPTPTNIEDDGCNDSPLRMKVWNESQQKFKMQSCEWVGRIEEKIEERCASISVNGEANAAHCAKTCGVSNCSQQDSNSRFKVYSPEKQKLLSRYCTFAANKPEERCAWEGMADTCRATCAGY